jgi:hypothetical protein
VSHSGDRWKIIVGRKVDLVSKRGSDRRQNWIHRREILEIAQTVYVL